MVIRDVTKVQDLVPVRHAFISLYDKTQSVQLADQLFSICPGLKIFSSGGTYNHLKKEISTEYAGQLIDVSEYTEMPETEGGLVKTLHHKMFLGYLTETFSESHQKDLARENAVPIDLVIIDMYPFNMVTADPESSIEKCRGHIDVGGPSALRAAAKNYLRVMTVPDYTPFAYDSLIAGINRHRGCTDLSMRRLAAGETFKTLSFYDSVVADFFGDMDWETLEKTYQIV